MKNSEIFVKIFSELFDELVIIYDVIPYENMQFFRKSKHEGPSLNITIMGHNNASSRPIRTYFTRWLIRMNFVRFV